MRGGRRIPIKLPAQSPGAAVERLGLAREQVQQARGLAEIQGLDLRVVRACGGAGEAAQGGGVDGRHLRNQHALQRVARGQRHGGLERRDDARRAGLFVPVRGAAAGAAGAGGVGELGHQPQRLGRRRAAAGESQILLHGRARRFAQPRPGGVACQCVHDAFLSLDVGAMSGVSGPPALPAPSPSFGRQG